jgi:Flp pilus assembly protein TadB
VSGDSAIRLDGQAGDVAVGDVAGGALTKISGADANRIVDLLQAQLQYSWDDDQRREVRQAQTDAERQRDRDETAMQWRMTRQRLDVVVQRLDHLDATAAETHAEARRVRVAGLIIAAALAALFVAVIVLLVDRYYLAALARALIGATGALGAYYVRSR